MGDWDFMKKFVAALLVGAMLFAMGACSSEAKITETSMAPGDVDIAVDSDGVIASSDDATWYKMSSYEIETEYRDPHYQQITNGVLSADETSILTLVQGYLINSDGIPFGEEGYQREFAHVCEYDYTTGERLFFMDLTDFQRYVEDENGQQEYMVVSALKGDDNYFVIYRYYNYTNGVCEYHVAAIAPDGAVIEDTVPVNLASKMDSDVNIYGSAVDGTRIVMLTGNWSLDSLIANPRIISYDVATDEVESCPMGVGLTAAGATMLAGLRKIDSTNYAVVAYSETEILALRVDISDMSTEMIDVAEAMSEITDDLTDLEWSQPCNSYSSDFSVYGEDFVAAYDLESGKFYKVVDFNHCNHNAYVFENGAAAVSSSEEYTVMMNGLLPRERDGVAGVYLFEKLDENPYAGRTLLVASALGRWMTYDECEMIYRYNDSQELYYVAIDNSYTPGSPEDFFDDYGAYAADTSEMTAQLMVDIMAGDGPDIILDGFEYEELNKDDCLVDLMPHLENSGIFDDEIYYARVFELALNGGALYQVPTRFCVAGITTPISSLESYSQRGFTFDEYINLVNGECNGYDPISSYYMNNDRIDYFVLLFNAMRNEFINDGRIDLDNDAFYALADYVLNNVNDVYATDDSIESGVVDHRYSYYLYGQCYIQSLNSSSAVAGDLRNFSATRGLPSIDGRGPLLVGENSIGVTTSCASVEGAVDFIEYALGRENQSNQLYASGNSVRRDVTRDYLNNYNVRVANENEIRVLEDPMFRPYIYTDEDIELSLELFSAEVDGTSGYYGGDNDIFVILYEEMPAYFSGDKSLEEVIAIIEDRAQTVLNERG